MYVPPRIRPGFVDGAGLAKRSPPPPPPPKKKHPDSLRAWQQVGTSGHQINPLFPRQYQGNKPATGPPPAGGGGGDRDLGQRRIVVVSYLGRGMGRNPPSPPPQASKLPGA